MDTASVYSFTGARKILWIYAILYFDHQNASWSTVHNLGALQILVLKYWWCVRQKLCQNGLLLASPSRNYRLVIYRYGAQIESLTTQYG